MTFLLFSSDSRSQEQPAPSGSYKKANKERIECYVMLLRLRHDLLLRWKETGKWPDDVAANEALAGHSAYWGKLLTEGKVIMTGGMEGDYWDNEALIVFTAENEEEAHSLMKGDPAVKAYVFHAQVRPFVVHALTDQFCQD